MEDIKIVYKGKKRPLIYVPNFGNIYINDGDMLTICIDSRGYAYVYKQDVFNYEEYHRYMCYLSSLIPYKIHGLCNTNEKNIEIFKDILLGNSLTRLEYDLQCVQKIVERLPKKDIIFAGYNFTNQFRPTYKFTYKNSLYNGSYMKNLSAESLAFYVYRNALRLLPEGAEEVNAEDFEKLTYLYEN